MISQTESDARDKCRTDSKPCIRKPRPLTAVTAGGPFARERGKLVGHLNVEAGRGKPANIIAHSSDRRV